MIRIQISNCFIGEFFKNLVREFNLKVLRFSRSWFLEECYHDICLLFGLLLVAGSKLKRRRQIAFLRWKQSLPFPDQMPLECLVTWVNRGINLISAVLSYIRRVCTWPHCYLHTVGLIVYRELNVWRDYNLINWPYY